MSWLAHYLAGWMRVRLRGFSPERFFNLCKANDIEVWGLSCEKEGYEFRMTVDDFRRIRPLVRKSKVRLRVMEKFGLPFFLYRNRRRKLYFAGLLSFFLVLYAMSLFIWDISFEGNTRYTYDVLVHYLDTQDIRYGMRKSEVDCEGVEAALRTQFSEITWVSARVSGTRLLIQVKENEVLSSIPVKDETPCDLVASRAGLIERMVVRRGVPQVAVGDQVEEGQVLVKGVVIITNDAEEEVNRHYVHSDADIIARTAYDYEQTFPRLKEVKAETGRKRNGYFLKVLGYSMTAILPRPADSTWKMVTEDRQMKLFQNFYLPIYAGKISGKEYVSYERPYTQEEKQLAAETVRQEFAKNLIEKGVQIIENNVKILENESTCKVQGHLTASESIGRPRAITETEPETGPEETINPDERN